MMKNVVLLWRSIYRLISPINEALRHVICPISICQPSLTRYHGAILSYNLPMGCRSALESPESVEGYFLNLPAAKYAPSDLTV